MSSICWSCGAEVDCIFTAHYFDGRREKRCAPCHERLAPMNPEHVGKLSAMDLLPVAMKVPEKR